jgi:hypothetical protein
LNQTLVATANNDVLVGLDIQSTFTTGAFTGTTSAALRVNGAIINLGSQPNIGTSANAFGTLVSRNVRSDVDLSLGAGYSATGENGLRMFSSTRNVVIQNGGTFTDAGYRLDVNGTSRFQNHLFQSSGFALISLGNNLNLRSNIQGGSGYIIDVQSYNTLNSTNSEQGFANFLGTYAPTSASGSPLFNALKVTPTINQTGGANGITRGLYINPTLTAASDWRAIEVVSGITILGAATTAKASLRIPSGTAPTSPVNGDIWFDGTNLNVRIGGVTRTIVVL